jgi:tRNA-(ms[2]io[6]A)-hydroxylase
MSLAVELPEISAFLLCETPDKWVEVALCNQDIMLIDHANCEKKAASTALNLIYRCVDKYDLLNKMSKLAREELMHFEQVIKIMKKRNIEYRSVSAARYAAGMRESMRTSGEGKLTDTLIVGAYIEARSCERFYKIAPFLDEELQKFYLGLLASESRHFKDYLKLAQKYCEESIDDRVEHFGEIEKNLILAPDSEFRFHSGTPDFI